MSNSRTRIPRRALLAGASVATGLRRASAAAPRPPSGNPGTQFYDGEERRELNEALESRTLFRWYGPSEPKKVTAFEAALARRMGVKYALGVTSGTAALHTAMAALGVGPGDEVILPAWGWHSCYSAILMTGALPVFADIDRSLNLDPADVERKITPQTKAIMVLQLYGSAANMDALMAVARRHKLRVVEDAAQAVGATYKGRAVGALADIGMYSFQISKTITAGEGGAVVTNDPLLFEHAARFQDLGLLRPGHEAMVGKAALAAFPGVVYRMNEMTGAVLCAQLRKLDTIVGALRRNARALRDGIADLPGIELRQVPDPEGEIGSGLFLFCRDKQARDAFLKAMRAEKAVAIPPTASLYLPGAPYIEQKVAPHPAWPTFNTPRGKAIRYGAACCPKTTALIDRCACLPIGPKDSPENLRDLAAAVRRCWRG